MICLGKFKVPSECGDVTIEWNPKEPKDVEMAREFFEKQKDAGNILVAVVNGRPKRLEQFDTEAASMTTIIVAPKAKHGC